MLKRAEKLAGVHPKLVAVVNAAALLLPFDLYVVEGLRTVERQRELVAAKKSKTMNSRHLPQPDGYGHAVDLFNGKDWKEESFFPIHKAMMEAARLQGVRLTWGGDFNGDGHTVGRDNWDCPHFQIEL